MNKNVIKDISVFHTQSLAIVYEDPETKARDVAFFRERASEQELDELKIWEPRPDDVTMTVEIEMDLLEKLEEWAAERKLEVEQILRAFLVYFVKYNTRSI